MEHAHAFMPQKAEITQSSDRKQIYKLPFYFRERRNKMARAMKCDRCGSFYENERHTRLDFSIDSLDLCPKCTSDFKDFMKMEYFPDLPGKENEK